MRAITSKALLKDLRELIAEARQDVARQVNSALVLLYWRVSHRIRQDILNEKRAEYGEQIVATLSTQLADPMFLNLIMNTDDFQKGIKTRASRAIGQANINASSLASYEIPLPPLDVQRRIVEEIEVERKLVEANKKLIEIYEQKIQAKLAEIWGEEKND